MGATCVEDELVTVLNDFEERVQIAERDLLCVQEHGNAFVKNVKVPKATIRELQVEKQSIKN